MLGTVVNVLAIIAGGAVGILFGGRLPDKMKNTVIQGIGLAVVLIGLSMALKTNNSVVVIASLVIGGIIGEWVDIELRLEQLGEMLQRRLSKGNNNNGNFTKAFVSASLIYCVGAMAIMGALESGLKGDHSILYAKSMLDGISAIVFASSMGIGVIAAAAPVFVYQGSITVAASSLQNILTPLVISEMTATGGLLILGIGLTILEIKQIKVGNLLPSVFIAIPFTILFSLFNI